MLLKHFENIISWSQKHILAVRKHNGLKHIAATLGTQNYARLRFGIGNDFPKGGQIDFVLGHFDEESMKLMPERLEVAQEIIKSFCLAGLNITMNQYNNK